LKRVNEKNYLIEILRQQYLIAEMIQSYITDKGPYNYQTLNDVMGALAGAQMEFYRKVVAPYENKKEIINGSVY
jgi:hypothetical protein